jgi:hypothetical protein
MEQYDDSELLLLNNCPVDDFLGLTPTEMHYLAYDTYNINSPIQFRSDIDDQTINQIPLFRIVEEYLKILHHDKQIKLTPLGTLPKKVIVELYDKRILLDRHIESGISKLWREQDCFYIYSARRTAELAGLVRKANGKLTLTKKSQKLLLPENRVQLFILFFQSFTEKFPWSSNDLFPSEGVGQFGWAFSVLMLTKFGDVAHLAEFYSEKYLKVFPNFIFEFEPRYSSREEYFQHCYSIRTFERFFLWFGFVSIEQQKHYLDLETDKIQRSEVVSKVFQIED